MPEDEVSHDLKQDAKLDESKQQCMRKEPNKTANIQ
jgi:hypothetical protein